MQRLLSNASVAFIALFLATGPLVFAANNEANAQIEFTFTGFNQQAGTMMAQVSCGDQPGERVVPLQAQAAVTGPRVTLRFPAQPAGRVCNMQAFRDTNGNKKLDRNAIGIPSEPYAFSNNAPARFGPPKAEAMRFTLRAGLNAQTITIR